MNEVKQKKVLFVDDDPTFLDVITEFFGNMSKGTWLIYTAQNHAQALDILAKQRLDLVVLDVDMPVMDGIQFLQLITRTHPGQQVVMLSGRGGDEVRRRCSEAGAVLFLEKLLTPEGFSAAFAALDALAGAQQGAGFQGMMRRVGLQEVLQLECLGGKSSVLEVFTGRIRGRIYVNEGVIVHAEAGSLTGEMALYSILALHGGGFNLLPYTEPAQRTIEGHWEFLLMEAARLSDEGSLPNLYEEPPAQFPHQTGASALAVHIEEMLLCSRSGEVLHAWQCSDAQERLDLLQLIEAESRQISALAPIGLFQQLTVLNGQIRTVCQVRMDRQLFVQSAAHSEETR